MKFIQLTLFIIFAACGKNMRNSTSPSSVSKPVQYLGCSVYQTLEGATINCPDGSSANISNGNGGSQGIPGANGSSCTVQQTSSGATIACTDGTAAHIYNGAQGLGGADGSSCSVLQSSQGALITCGANSVNISNGLNGTGCSVVDVSNGAIVTCGLQAVLILDGEDAPITPYAITELIDPCGDSPGFDEVLLRLGNGQLVAHFSSGGKEFLSVIGAGNYQTTDASNCHFSVSNTGIVTW